MLGQASPYIIIGALCFFLGYRANSPPKARETIAIDLTEQQAQTVWQNARLGWISLEEARKLIKDQSVITYQYRDSLIVRDSLNVRDSLILTPVYETKDTLLVFNGEDKENNLSGSFSLIFKNKFYPEFRKFAPEFKPVRLEVKRPKNTHTLWDRIHISLQTGAGYGWLHKQLDVYTGLGVSLDLDLSGGSE
jgi:hypothetical protein